MPGNVQEIYELSIARLPTEQYDRTILSLLVRCLSIGRGKHGCPSHSLIFLHALHLVYALLSPELLTSLSTSVGRWRRWRDQGPGNLTTDLIW